MLTAFLIAVVGCCLFYGRIPTPLLILICSGFGFIWMKLGKHEHTSFLSIDILAQNSRLNRVNPTLKFWTILILIVLCVSARNSVTGLFLAFAMLLLTVFAGGLALHDYIHLLMLPITFLMVSSLALLFDITAQSTGVFNFQIFEFWLCISVGAQSKTMLVIARVLGAISCMYLLSLTTPMPELIGVLRRTHCPEVLIELMYLIYRYIFILFSMYRAMRDAAASRLGFADHRTNMRTSGNLYANLLSRSYRQANKHFDAMESRCYDTGIRFLERREPVTRTQAVTAVSLIIFTVCLSSLFY